MRKGYASLTLPAPEKNRSIPVADIFVFFADGAANISKNITGAQRPSIRGQSPYHGVGLMKGGWVVERKRKIRGCFCRARQRTGLRVKLMAFEGH
jgi:hypothetical protein